MNLWACSPVNQLGGLIPNWPIQSVKLKFLVPACQSKENNENAKLQTAVGEFCETLDLSMSLLCSIFFLFTLAHHSFCMGGCIPERILAGALSLNFDVLRNLVQLMLQATSASRYIHSILIHIPRNSSGPIRQSSDF
uniref:Uncharacterized protein n=1 Tax=Nelumbo nucifera TaxID=4432 RepID=A0A822YU64_NELNU|nr:TPA_asm: hypothetical protein HUJ06_005741 [Nelumbo nucifera]